MLIETVSSRNKTKSRYVGKKLEGYDLRKIAKDYDLRSRQLLSL